MKKFFAKIGQFFRKAYQIVRGFFKRVFAKIGSYKLTTLVMMQLKDKWNLSFKTDKKGSFFKISAYIILFVVITALTFVIMNYMGNNLHIFIGYKIPLNAMIPILAVLTLFEGVSILIGMTRSLFFAKDNVVLITYPVKSNTLFISKLIVYYFDALKKSLTLFMPVVIGFGLIYGYSTGFYFLAFFLDFFYMAIIVLVCGLLSIPTCYILRFIDKYRLVKIIFSLILAGAFVYLAILLIGVIPANINLMEEYDKFSRGLNNFLYNFSLKFSVLTAITKMFLGAMDKSFSMTYLTSYTLFGILIMIGLIGVLVVGNAFLSKPFYTKMIATSNISKKPATHERKNHRFFKTYSVFKYETMRILRNEKLIITSIICIIVMPLFTILANKIYGSINTRPSGQYYIYAFNFLFILIVTTAHNTSSAYIYSKDGPSWPVNKTMPVNPQVSLSLRLIYNEIASLAIIIPSTIIFFSNYKSKLFSMPAFLITLIVLAIFHSVLSASYDYSHSKNKDKADIGSEIITSHEMVSLGYGLAICIGYLLLMIMFRLTATVNPDTRILIIALLLLVFEIWFFLRKIRLTYQEN